MSEPQALLEIMKNVQLLPNNKFFRAPVFGDRDKVLFPETEHLARAEQCANHKDVSAFTDSTDLIVNFKSRKFQARDLVIGFFGNVFDDANPAVGRFQRFFRS